MANYRGHVLGASFFYLLYMMLLAFLGFEILPDDSHIIHGFAFPISLSALTIAFGLWPDIDTNSRAQGIFYGLIFLLDIFLILMQEFEIAAYVGLLAMLPILAKHRGWTHAKWAAFVVPSPIFILPLIYNTEAPWAGAPFYGAAVVGYISHLFFDGLILKSKRKKG